MIRSLKNRTRIFTNYTNSVCFIVILTLVSCKDKTNKETLPFINQPDFTPEWINKNDAAYRSIHTIPTFSFTDQDGKTVTEKTVDGKIYVADFFFTRCGSICPKMTNNIGILQSTFKDND